MLIQSENDKIIRLPRRPFERRVSQKRLRMETRKLGNSDLKITPVGFGAWALGGSAWEFAWGPQDDAASIAAFHRALGLGVNSIDTAAVSGLGHAQSIVGRAAPPSQRAGTRLYFVRAHRRRFPYRGLDLRARPRIALRCFSLPQSGLVRAALVRKTRPRRAPPLGRRAPRPYSG